ncbi:cell envelope integrity protein CreD [Dongia sp.]|uniref:cell envelope integrity protein CreD n=1 Tax=Dongia sp. TaxID=1977262 RepID=UPI0037521119
MSDQHPDIPRQENAKPRQPWHRSFGLGTAGFEATKRAVFLGLLMLVLLIPLNMIEGLVYERDNRKLEVDSEITSQWGGPQTILGPILVVPYRYVSEAGDAASGTPRLGTSQLYFLPKHLEIATDVKAERRAKSIYEVLVYGGTAHLTGDFAGLSKPRADVAPEMIDWSAARLLIGIADPSAIRSMTIAVADQAPVAEDALQRDAGLSSSLALAASLSTLDLAKPVGFSIAIDFRGSSALRFAPIADVTRVSLKSDWPHPDFSGRSLPDERNIGAQGFDATWSLGALTRGFPATWRLGEANPETLWNTTVGVTFVEPGDVHQQTDRILKYGVLVIALTFATIFISGLFGGKKVHPIQYLMVGAALCLFYLLLLSLSEHIAFLHAYVIASAADIGMIAWYAWRTMSRKLGYAVAVILTAVQAYIYDLLQMDDYALLAGTVALFVALLAAMIVTRNIDWYRIGKERAA